MSSGDRMAPRSVNRLRVTLDADAGIQAIDELCRRVQSLPTHRRRDAPSSFECEVHLRGSPNLTTIDALARLQLTALRVGASITFRCPNGHLVELVAMVGLHEVINVIDPRSEDRA